MQATFAGWFSKQSTDHLNSSALIFLTLGIQRSCVKTWLLFKSTEQDYRVFRTGINICGKNYRIFLRMQNIRIMEYGLCLSWCIFVITVWLQSQEKNLPKLVMLSILSHLAKGLRLLFSVCLTLFFFKFFVLNYFHCAYLQCNPYQ